VAQFISRLSVFAYEIQLPRRR